MVFGFYMGVQTFREIRRGDEAAAWPTVPATLESCEIDAWDDDGTTAYYLDVTYSFSIDGKRYTATGIHPAVHAGGIELRELYDKLKGHTVVLARYNPANPSEAYLVTGSFSKHWGGFAGEVLMFTFGLLFLLTGHCAMPGYSAYAERLVVIR